MGREQAAAPCWRRVYSNPDAVDSAVTAQTRRMHTALQRANALAVPQLSCQPPASIGTPQSAICRSPGPAALAVASAVLWAAHSPRGCANRHATNPSQHSTQHNNAWLGTLLLHTPSSNPAAYPLFLIHTQGCCWAA